MPGRPSAKVKATLTEIVPRRRLVWDGKVGAEWLFAGQHEGLNEALKERAEAHR